MDFIERLSQFFNTMANDASMLVIVLVSTVAFAVLYYYLMKFMADNNSGYIIPIFVLIMLIVGCIIVFNKSMNNAIFLCVPAIAVLIIFILYPTEIKRIIWSRRNMKMVDVKHDAGVYDEEKAEVCINEIIKSLQDMSKNDVGAIVVLSNGNVPSQILDSGVRLDSDISSELIESVFFPKSPLHDGAMIINGTKIVSAGCFLPLSQKDNIPKDLGTRHRAGLGITETIDVVSLIVSEETGIITVASAGKFTRYADYEMLKKTLKKYYWQQLNAERR